jgi:RimJ/RimL family protein N-acetyltransferase
MKLVVYSPDKYEEKIENYQLKETTYTASPKEAIAKINLDVNRHPIAILNDVEELVGFFCLHVKEGPEDYGFHGAEYALIRAFSIDSRYRNLGYASRTFDEIFDFVNAQINQGISRLILAVNERNLIAQKVYRNAGFVVIKSGVLGRTGDLMIMEKVR